MADTDRSRRRTSGGQRQEASATPQRRIQGIAQRLHAKAAPSRPRRHTSEDAGMISSAWGRSVRDLSTCTVRAFRGLAAPTAARASSAMPPRTPPPRPQAVLVACGSFNPPTIMHLRMFDLAAHHLRQSGWDVVGQYMSPVGDAYMKPGLAPAAHRLRMCELATEGSEGVLVDGWEAQQADYTPTMDVLRHVQQTVLEDHRRAAAAAAAAKACPPDVEADASSLRVQPQPLVRLGSDMERLKLSPPLPAPASAVARFKEEGVRVMLLCGSDLLASLEVPGLWQSPDLLLQQHGVVCIARHGTDVEQLLAGSGMGPDKPASVLGVHGEHVHLVTDPITNQVSSSAVRRELASGGPVRFLVPDKVLQYIRDNDLYDHPPQQKGPC